MKAAYITQKGDPEILQVGELPKPDPGEHQVLVKIDAVSVNPIDTYIRSGAVPLEIEFPYIVGCDLAGVVEYCGEKATRFQPGDRVWGSNQSLSGRPGTFAEYVAVDECWLYPIPDSMTEKQAAAGALVGITAHLGLFLHGGLQEGETVFVNGGTGGVGSSVVQLARATGATVITTAGNEEKQDACRELGADFALNYNDEEFETKLAEIAESQGGIDLWFETLRKPTLERTIALMAHRGRIVLMAGRTAHPQFPVGAFYAKDLRAIGFAMFNATPDEQEDCAVELNVMFEKGEWTPRIGKVMSLDQVAEAHQLQEDNTLNLQGSLSGKIVLEV